MTTTPKDKKSPSSSADPGTTDFKDGLGRPIGPEAFENDSAPGEPKLSEGGKTSFDADTAAIKQAAEKLRG